MPSLTAPVFAYLNSAPPAPATDICAVISGYVYRGDHFPQFDGDYFFSDNCGNAVWSLRVANGVATEFTDRTSPLSPSQDGFQITGITSFGEDAAGELYIVATGGVFAIVPRTR